MKLAKIFAAIFVAVFFSAAAVAQLPSTERLGKNQWLPSDKAVLFGDYPNASIKYTGGNLVIDVLQGGGKVVFPDGVDLGTGNQSIGTSVVFEGATADAFETTLTVVDPTADRTVSLPDSSGTVFLSTAAQDAANSMKGVANGIEFEGATADAFETTITVTDPTADRTVTIPNLSGQVVLGGNSVVSSGANTACNTTCGSGKCQGGWDAGTTSPVGCADATADKCYCQP